MDTYDARLIAEALNNIAQAIQGLSTSVDNVSSSICTGQHIPSLAAAVAEIAHALYAFNPHAKPSEAP